MSNALLSGVPAECTPSSFGCGQERGLTPRTLQVLLAAGQDFVKLSHDAEKDEVCVELDPSLIESVGRPALGRFLLQLNVYKSTADFEAANALFSSLTSVGEDMLALRPAVLAKRAPKGVFVQPNTTIAADGQVVLQEYPATPEGMVDSFLDRF